MNIDKFIAYAQSKGISEIEVFLSKSSNTKISIFQGEVEHFGISEGQSLTALGIYQGKYGYAMTQKIDASAFDFLVNGIIQSARYNEKPAELGLFQGSDKYQKKNVYNKALPSVSVNEKIELLKQIEKKLLAYSPLICEVESVSYDESSSLGELHNSYGLSLKQKSNYFDIYAGVLAKKGEETKTWGGVFLGNDLSAFDIDAFVKKVAQGVLDKFGGKSILSKKYPTVLHRSVFASLLGYFISQTSAEEIE